MRITLSILAIAFVPACAADGSDSVMQQGAGKYEAVHSIGIGPDNGTVVGGIFREETDVGTGPLVAGGQEDGFVASYAADWTPRWSRVIGGADLDRDDFVSAVFVDA